MHEQISIFKYALVARMFVSSSGCVLPLPGLVHGSGLPIIQTASVDQNVTDNILCKKPKEWQPCLAPTAKDSNNNNNNNNNNSRHL